MIIGHLCLKAHPHWPKMDAHRKEIQSCFSLICINVRWSHLCTLAFQNKLHAHKIIVFLLWWMSYQQIRRIPNAEKEHGREVSSGMRLHESPKEKQIRRNTQEITLTLEKQKTNRNSSLATTAVNTVCYSRSS